MTQTQVPEQMTAVVLDAYSGVEALRVEQRPVPRPGKNEVLVKVAAAPINPSDLGTLAGRYGFKPKPPFTPGGEGAGRVVAAGPGAMGRYFMGKRVACLWNGQGDGAWAEYMVASTRGGVLPLDDAVSLEQGAMSTINPLTAIAFLDIAKKGGHSAIVLTAAASALGQKVNYLGQSEGMQIINIIRRDEQAQMLKEQGATIVLNSTDEDFCKQLRGICIQYDARLAFDAVAGPMAGQVLAAMPLHSKVTIFGGLSFKPAEVSPDELIFRYKQIDGFWLGPWIATKNPLQILRTWRRAQKLIASDLKSEIRAEYPLHEAKQAVLDYQRQMTGGKMLLKPNSK